MIKLTALQEMAAFNTLVEEIEDILWSYAQGVDTKEIEKAFNQALNNFRQGVDEGNK